MIWVFKKNISLGLNFGRFWVSGDFVVGLRVFPLKDLIALMEINWLEISFSGRKSEKNLSSKSQG